MLRVSKAQLVFKAQPVSRAQQGSKAKLEFRVSKATKEQPELGGPKGIPEFRVTQEDQLEFKE